MLRSISLLLISLAILSGCGNTDIIPEKDMVKILYKMHLIDGTLSMPNSSGTMDLPLIDSTDFYSKMFESYGYSAKQFSKSYYFYLGRPDILDGIYNKVITKLEVDNQRYDDSLSKETKLEQYWNLSSLWKIRGETSIEKIEFSVPISKKGIYTLKMVVTIGKDDQTTNLKSIIGTSTNNGTTIEALDSKQEVLLKKTGTWETYNFTITVPDNKPLYIKGRLLNYTADSAKKSNRNVFIRKITLSVPADAIKDATKEVKVKVRK